MTAAADDEAGSDDPRGEVRGHVLSGKAFPERHREQEEGGDHGKVDEAREDQGPQAHEDIDVPGNICDPPEAEAAGGPEERFRVPAPVPAEQEHERAGNGRKDLQVVAEREEGRAGEKQYHQGEDDGCCKDRPEEERDQG